MHLYKTETEHPGLCDGMEAGPRSDISGDTE
jgi:hypothetical protein